MDDGTFTKVEKSSKPMYGPRQILVCGYTKEEQAAFGLVLKNAEIESIDVKFLADTDGEKTLETILSDPAPDLQEPSTLRRAVIMSGLTQAELHSLLRSHRESGLPYPLWASLTPISESWPLSVLLETLAHEAEAMKKQQKNR